MYKIKKYTQYIDVGVIIPPTFSSKGLLNPCFFNFYKLSVFIIENLTNLGNLSKTDFLNLYLKSKQKSQICHLTPFLNYNRIPNQGKYCNRYRCLPVFILKNSKGGYVFMSKKDFLIVLLIIIIILLILFPRGL